MKRLKKRKRGAAMWIACVIFSIYAISLVYPFLYLLIGASKGAMEFLINPLGLPEKFSFDNYKDVIFNLEALTGLEGLSIGSMFFNSITLSVGLTAASMTLTAMASYVLSRYEFKGNHLIYMTIVISGLIPSVGSLAATFKLANAMHLTNTYIGMILMQGGGLGGHFLFLHAFFKGIPWSYAESAMIDGASDFTIFTRIMLPLASKAIMTFTIMRFLSYWNEYWFPSLFYDQHPTLAVGLTYISIATRGTGNYPLLFAAMIITIIPVLVMFALCHKQLMGNISGGGLKE